LRQNEPLTFRLCRDIQKIKGQPFPAHISLKQLLITGPPGSGKSMMVSKLGGWPEEGYIDLTLKRWWAASSLSFKPREVHLGFPFVGINQVLAVFEPEWLSLKEKPDIDTSRIMIPPTKVYFFSVDWFKRHVFEFLLPPAELLLERRLERQKKATHHVDQGLERLTIEQQLRAYQTAALFLHNSGFTVYCRESPDGQPLEIVQSEEMPTVPRMATM
jgi:hypothetical protein